MMYKLISFLLFLSVTIRSMSQDCYWQQKVNYEINVDFDAENHQFKGDEKITYLNSSPDTLKRVYFHLYFNAFQPGSMMDIRSRNIADPDSRIKDRIGELKDSEIGYHHIKSVRQGKDKVKYTVEETIMIVELNTPVLPGRSTEFQLDFESQVPVQIRRSGRDNDEGIAYSMSQWYPKIAEYDIDGWHPNPYVGREFHGVWGDFDVKIKMPVEFTIGGTGILQNAQSIGKNYEDTLKPLELQKGDHLLWHFKAKNVHDFVWAADKKYLHTKTVVPNGPTLHFLFKNDSTIIDNWNALQSYAVKCFELMAKLYGPYPYEQYSIIQAGDGGMEYPMATLITGGKRLGPLVSVMVHESIHSWFQGMLATNEARYAWMDEGFTSYAQHVVLDSIYNKSGKLNPHLRSYSSYFSLVKSGLQEPLTTHADHFNTNAAYGVAAYSMGEIFLHQLSYIIGQNALNQGMKEYFEQWKFKHPVPGDFKKIMEKVSGIELDWYFEYWISTTKTIDYGVEKVEKEGNSTRIYLEKIGDMPMPLDVEVRLANEEKRLYNIPLRMMYGKKKAESSELIYLDNWPWTYNSYYFEIDIPLKDIESIEIDPTQRMADIDRQNNTHPGRTRSFWGKLIK